MRADFIIIKNMGGDSPRPKMLRSIIMKLPETETELLKLKFQMELIRTICPILAIILQFIVIVKLF